ncbi:hypothetical protein M9Y10_037890 [Tritrichomonas musculus]|uniref:Uncharacterized protein n=1 Tax=Tritrichomonas musculus TaxID=1915356 RepID=A0ABR2K7G5_9EUKA
MLYKLPDDQKEKVIEFLANHSIEHEQKEYFLSYQQNKPDLPPNIDSALVSLFRGEQPAIAIQKIYDNVAYSYENDRLCDLEIILNSNILNFILPYANFETEYSVLNRTLRILNILSFLKQKPDSSFQNPLFAENMINIIEKSEKTPTIRKIALKVINRLLIDSVIGDNIFLNFIHFKIPSVILSSNMIEPATFNELMTKSKGQYVKVVSQAAGLLENLAIHCKENHLTIFASFYNIIIFYLTNDFTRNDFIKYDQKYKSNVYDKIYLSISQKYELTQIKFLHLLSLMMILDSNRKFAYSLQVPELILNKIVYRKSGSFRQYSYNIFYEIAAKDGLHPIFQSISFYNLTMDAIQNPVSVEVLSSIFKALGAIMPFDYKNLWENDIISQIYDVLSSEKYIYKLEAIMVYLKFLEVSSQDSVFCLNVLRSNDILSLICISIDFFSQDQIMYFIHVIKCLANERFPDLFSEMLNCQDVYEVFQLLSSNEDENIARSADEMLNMWRNTD